MREERSHAFVIVHDGGGDAARALALMLREFPTNAASFSPGMIVAAAEPPHIG